MQVIDSLFWLLSKLPLLAALSSAAPYSVTVAAACLLLWINDSTFVLFCSFLRICDATTCFRSFARVLAKDTISVFVFLEAT